LNASLETVMLYHAPIMWRGVAVMVSVLILNSAWAASYTVQPGDTLYSLAKRFQTTPAALTALNKLSSPNLRVGQTLEVPERTHAVAKGDTLFNIAKRYGVTMDALRVQNKLSGNAVSIGQVLVIPWEPSVTETASSKPVMPATVPSTASSSSKPFSVSSQPASSASAPSSATKPASSSVAPGSTTKPPASSPAPVGTTKPPASASNSAVQTNQNASSPTVPNANPSGGAAPSATEFIDPNRLPALPNRAPGMSAPMRPPVSLPTGASSARAIAPLPVQAGATLPSIGVEPIVLSGSDGIGVSVPVDPVLFHTVQAGETLFSIARRYGVTVNDLKTLNALTTDNLQAGQSLRIPGRLDPALPPVTGLRSIAERYLGVTYVYGGSRSDGLDCSGFVGIVFQELGVKLPRTSREQFQTGVGIDRSTLELGDLVFFDTTGKGVSHVGIYLGDGAFIHAASNPGKVIESQLSERYYASRYLGARRVLPQD
jgi:peptidoglycan DL-endopeptidase LytE